MSDLVGKGNLRFDHAAVQFTEKGSINPAISADMQKKCFLRLAVVFNIVILCALR